MNYMIRTALGLLLCLIASQPTFAQVELFVEGPEELDPQQEIEIIVSAQGIDSVSSAQLTFSWSSESLQLQEYESLPVTQGGVADVNTTPLDLADSSLVFLLLETSGSDYGTTISEESALIRFKFQVIGKPGEQAYFSMDTAATNEIVGANGVEKTIVASPFVRTIRQTVSTNDQLQAETVPLRIMRANPNVLEVEHPASLNFSYLQLYSFDGRCLHTQRVEPGLKTSRIAHSGLDLPAITILRYISPEKLLTTVVANNR